MKKLSNDLPEKSFNIAGQAVVPSLTDFQTKAAYLFEQNKNICDSILVVLLEDLVCKCAIGQNNPVIKEKAKNFYWWLDTMSHVACDVVADDLGGAPSKRYMQVLNAN